MSGQLDMGQLSVFLSCKFRRLITNIHRIHATRNFNHRCIAKSFRKFFSVDGGRSDNELEIVSAIQQGL